MTRNLTLSTFCAESHIPATLIRAVSRQVGGWQSFKEMAEDVANAGAGAGFSGFIYYADTQAFFRRNKNAILEVADDLADSMGVSTLTCIAGFNCLKTDEGTVAEAIHNPRSKDPEKVRNALAWFALEEVARNYVDLCHSA